MKEALREGSLSKLCYAVKQSGFALLIQKEKKKKSLLEKEGISLCKETKTQKIILCKKTCKS